MPAEKGARAARKTQPPLSKDESAAGSTNQKTGFSAPKTMSENNKNKITAESAAINDDSMQMENGSEIMEDATAINATSAVDIDSEGESGAVNDVDMVEVPTRRPVTPTNAKTPTTEPITPLKPVRKRPRADTTDPEKPAKSANKEGKEDGDALRQRLCNSLKDTVAFMQQARIACPDYNFYGSLIGNLKSAIEEIENASQKKQAKGLATSPWASVTQDANVSKDTIVIKRPGSSKAPRVKVPQQAAKTKAKVTPKESKDDRQVIIRLKKDLDRPELLSHTLRNNLNKVMGTTAITSVELSARGNIVITTNKPFTASQLMAREKEWKSVFDAYEVEAAEIPTSWVKLVAHGVPVLPEVDTISIFQQEVETFNPVKVKGNPRWLKAPTEEKRAGSVVFAVPTEDEGIFSLKNGLYIAGVRVKVAAFKTFTHKTQCYRCQGFGHNPSTCNKPVACAICAKRHLTRVHKCNSCSASQLCEHATPACANCKGNHMANNKECEVYKAVTS